jgi:hypothetical protein
MDPNSIAGQNLALRNGLTTELVRLLLGGFKRFTPEALPGTDLNATFLSPLHTCTPDKEKP